MLRICLILAIVAGIGAGAVEMIFVKNKMVETMDQRDQEKKDKETAQSDATKTHKELTTTKDVLKKTQEELATTQTEFKNRTARADELDKQKITLTARLNDVMSNLDSAQADLNKWTALNVTPNQVIALQDNYKRLLVTKEVVESTNKFLLQKTKELQAKIDYYMGEGHIPELPQGLKAEILAVDPKYQFVVLNKGMNDGVVARAQLLVSRNGKLVGKVSVASVDADHCVADIMPEWKHGEIMEHDQAIGATLN